MASKTVQSGIESTILVTPLSADPESTDRYDVVIKFLSAEDLSKSDILSEPDPYFIAGIDQQVTYKSSSLRNTLSPKWDGEEWIVRNIPRTAKLFVAVFDKDVQGNSDDHVGQFEIDDLINYQSPSEGHDILTLKGKKHGRFHLSIEATESPEESKQLPEYTFDGPCRYSRNDLVYTGRIAKVNEDGIYPTWIITMKRVSVFFPSDESQYWDQNYKAGRKIFGPNPLTVIWRDTIKLAHKAIFESRLDCTASGRLDNTDDLWKLIFSDKNGQRLKPCLYTYIIDDNTWRFSETREKGFVHFISKHAVFANGLEYVRYAGEFHIRPKNGWDKPGEEWELVIDNGSGTYAPTPDLLDKLKELFLFNFPGLNVVTYDFNDPLVKESKKHLK